MADENRGDNETGSTPSGGAENQSGDPGRTPGQAEGDEETVEESLAQKES